MKKVHLLSLVSGIVCFFLTFNSCSNPSTESPTEQNATTTKTEEFSAQFVGDYTYVGPDTLPKPKCTDTLNAWRAIVDGKGTANIMGKLRVHFDFCGNANGYYGNTYAYIVDKAMDTLFITCAGQVIQGRTEEHPDFVTSYWKDDFVITGGTGKYEGASGSGKTDDYNSSEDPNSHHQWKGMITLKSNAE